MFGVEEWSKRVGGIEQFKKRVKNTTCGWYSVCHRLKGEDGSRG